MVKTLPADLLQEIAKEVSHIAHLIQFSFSTTKYYTDCDQDIYYDGNWYLTKPINFDAAQYSTRPTIEAIKITISNVDRTFSNLVLSEDIRSKEVQLSRIWLDKNLGVIGTASLILIGYVDEITIDKRQAEIMINDEMIKWKTLVPRRIHENKCTWQRFGGTECAYAGAEIWCDRSWERCSELGNTINFGGFRWLNNIQDKEIWWGRKQKTWWNIPSEVPL